MIEITEAEAQVVLDVIKRATEQSKTLHFIGQRRRGHHGLVFLTGLFRSSDAAKEHMEKNPFSDGSIIVRARVRDAKDDLLDSRANALAEAIRAKVGALQK